MITVQYIGVLWRREETGRHECYYITNIVDKIQYIRIWILKSAPICTQILDISHITGTLKILKQKNVYDFLFF